MNNSDAANQQNLNAADDTAPAKKAIGILGGTFDPIHHGHLRLAVEIYERMGLSEVRLIPSANPPHRNQPMASSQVRLMMVEAAIKNVAGLVADGRELRRTGPSYMVDTLAELRAENPDSPLFLIMGMDAFMGLSRWYQWEKLITLGHLIVVKRPGTLLPMVHTMRDFLTLRQVNAEHPATQQPAGSIIVEEIPGLMISSTQIRALLASGRNPRYLLPSEVVKVIEEQKLYR